MAQTNQEISIKLTVESAGFKEEMLKARKALHAIEGAGVKAAGGQKKYAAAIKQARLALRQANGTYKEATTSLQLHEIQAQKTANATVKLGKTQKQSNMAMTQAAYAIDDMQYGFQGVQNNIQAMAVSMGASGPLIVGLTLLTVGIGLLVNKFKKAKKEALAVQKALGEKQGLIATTLRHAEVVKTTKKGTEEYEESLKALKKNGYDKAKMSVDQYTDALIRQKLVEAQLEANADKIKDLLVERIKAQDKLTRVTEKPVEFSARGAGVGQAGMTPEQLKAANKAAVARAKSDLGKIDAKLKDTVKLGANLQKILNSTKVTGGDDDDGDDGDAEELGVAYSHGLFSGFKSSKIGSEIFSNMKKGIKEVLELQKAEGADKEELMSSELAQLQAIDLKVLSLEEQAQVLHNIKVLQAEIANIPGIADNMVGVDKATIAMEKFKDQLADIKLMLDEGVISWDEYVRRIDNATESYNKVAVAQQNTVDVGGMLTGQLTSLISGFAEAAGSGDNMGNALLKGLGNMLVQLGGLIIAAGVAALNLVITLSNPAMAPLAIAAGAALVAAGAAVSSFANKAGGGGGSSSAGRASSSSSSTVIDNPVRENARVRNSNLIIPMDMMRYGNQVAEDNYSGFN